jgi:hypothetical protein
MKAKKKRIYDSPLMDMHLLGDQDLIHSKDKETGELYGYKASKNSLGYRSDEFKKEHEGKHILFAGCSETFGFGSVIEESWPYIVYNEIKNESDVSGYYNIGVPGAGFKEIIMEVIDYCDKYDNPDTIFILFPNLERYIWYIDTFKDKEMNGYYGVCLEENFKPKITGDQDLVVKKRKGSHSNNKEEYANFVMMMRMLEVFCIKNNIDLFWSTWDVGELRANLHSNKYNLKFYLPISLNREEIYHNIKVNNIPFRKRDGHGGYAIHQFWAKQMLGAYWGRTNAKK